MADSVLRDIQNADTNGWHQILKEYADWTKEWSQVTSISPDQVVIDPDIRTKEAYELIKSQWNSIKQQVIEQLPPAERTPYQFSRRNAMLAQLVQRVECGIPPNETGIWPNVEPATMADIWNTAWACKVNKFKSSSALEFSDYLEMLCQLTLKAVEASFVHSTFAPHLP